MNILITGGSGLLGQYLNLILSKNNSILTLYNSNIGNCTNYQCLKTDLADKEQLKTIFTSFNPDIVIHTAAISRPELCDELPKNFILDVNVNITLELARLCDKHNSKLIYTSTDLVYDGDSGEMHDENSIPNPVSLYAETKIMSEDGIKIIFDNYIILRTSLLYGMGLNHSVNNFHNMYHSFKNNKPVKLFYDQFRTPLSLIDAAELIERLINTDVKGDTFNFGGRERVSRVELGKVLCDIGKFDRLLIVETSMEDAPVKHKVKDVSMNSGKLQSLGLKQKSIEDSVTEILKNISDS